MGRGKIVPALIVTLMTGLILAGCGPAATPEPVPTAAPVIPTLVPPVTPEAPPPTLAVTRTPEPAQPTPTATPAPGNSGPLGSKVVPTPTPTTLKPDASLPPRAWPETTWLTAMMDILPASAATTGVWLSNPAKALEFAGLEPARSFDEWLERTPEQHEEYQRAREGMPNTSLQNTVRQFHAEWEDAFGFGPWHTNAMAETGEIIWSGFELNVLTGRFDTEQVRQKLLGLGYETRIHLGHEYLAVPEGERPTLDSPLRHLVNPNVRNVFTDGTILLTAPDTAGMEELLSVRAGEALSLGQHPAFGDLTALLPNPFFVSILSRKAVLEPEHPPFRQYEPRPDWGDMGNWEALSAGFSRPSPETRKITVSLWYQDLPDAQAAVEELALRFKSFSPPEPNPMVFLQDMCLDHWKTEAVASPAGAVLTVSCRLEADPSSEGLGTLMWNILDDGTLAFLVR